MKASELKHLLCDGCTLALSDGVETITSAERGVKPLLRLIDSGRDYCSYVAADKVVGRAAALLYTLLGIRELYAGVISRGAVEVCRKHGIAVEYGVIADRIINRKGDGVCPMEEATAGIDDPQAAYDAICKKLISLQNK